MVINERLLQVWDYFLVAGWKAMIKMSLYVCVASQKELQEMPFEGILTHIGECPSKVLNQEITEGTTIYKVLKQEFTSVKVSFHLERLQKEFEKIHNHYSTDKPQPVFKQY